MSLLVAVLAILIGVTLGLIGGGGSILTVPVLVYLAGVSPVLATAYSLFIVGISALFGAADNIRKRQFNLIIAILFAIPSFIAVYITRAFIVPAIPQEIFQLGQFVLTKDIGIMLLFATIIFLAAYTMITDKEVKTAETNDHQLNYYFISAEGFVVGSLTGLVGAGGGFLIIPALVIFAKLPMKEAVGTSLIIVAIKSLIGFIGDIQAGQLIDWKFLIIFSSLSILGILVGGHLSNHISNNRLKSGFGWFVLAMGIFIVLKELVFR